MQVEYNYPRLSAKLRAQILKQIFKDLGPKNLKGVQFFYLILRPDELEMQFISNAKDILITIILKRALFQNFDYNRQRPALRKFALDDFTGLGFMFENNKAILDLQIEETMWIIRQTMGKGFVQFIALPLNCDQDDQDCTINESDFGRNENSLMELRLARVGLFEGILSYSRGCKLGTIWFRFESVKKMLEVTDREENFEIKWLLKVEDFVLNKYFRPMELDCKTLNCALNLLPNDSQLKLTFYSTFMLLEVPEKDKYFTIKLSSKAGE